MNIRVGETRSVERFTLCEHTIKRRSWLVTNTSARCLSKEETCCYPPMSLRDYVNIIENPKETSLGQVYMIEAVNNITFDRFNTTISATSIKRTNILQCVYVLPHPSRNPLGQNDYMMAGATYQSNKPSAYPTYQIDILTAWIPYPSSSAFGHPSILPIKFCI
jgi:hypothetical protein